MISTVVQYSIERVVQIIKYLYRIDYVVWEMGLMRWWIISWTWDDQRERRIIRLTKWMNKWMKDSFEVDDIVKTLISNDRETHIHLSINKRKHNKWQTIYYYDKPHLKNNHTYRYMDEYESATATSNCEGYMAGTMKIHRSEVRIGTDMALAYEMKFSYYFFQWIYLLVFHLSNIIIFMIYGFIMLIHPQNEHFSIFL